MVKMVVCNLCSRRHRRLTGFQHRRLLMSQLRLGCFVQVIMKPITGSLEDEEGSIYATFVAPDAFTNGFQHGRLLISARPFRSG